VEYSFKHLWQTLARFQVCNLRRVERRRDSRLPAHGNARIHWDADGACVRSEVVSLLGASERGFSFRSTEPFAPGQKMLIEVDQQEFEVVVRHSAPDGREFIIGAEIASTRPSPAGAATVANRSADTASRRQ
jgi:hypothetical protein